MANNDTTDTLLLLWTTAEVWNYFCWLSTSDLALSQNMLHTNTSCTRAPIGCGYPRFNQVATNSLQSLKLFLPTEHFWLGIEPKYVAYKSFRFWSTQITDTDTLGPLLFLSTSSKIFNYFCWLSTFELAWGQNLLHMKYWQPGSIHVAMISLPISELFLPTQQFGVGRVPFYLVICTTRGQGLPPCQAVAPYPKQCRNA